MDWLSYLRTKRQREMYAKQTRRALVARQEALRDPLAPEGR